MGFAVGCIGMSRREFSSCYFDEFESICRAWHDKTEGDRRDDWERTRILAAISIQPHIKRKITPAQLLPLPWDGKGSAIKQSAPELSPQERRKRFEKLAGI